MNHSTVPVDGIATHGKARSVEDILTVAVGTVIATSLFARHLSRLRRQSYSLASYSSFSYTLIPTFALADIILGLVRFNQHRKTGRPLRYCLAVALDLRALPSDEEKDVYQKETKELETPSLPKMMAVAEYNEDSIPLAVVSPQNLEAEEQLKDWRWNARLASLILFVAYAFVIEVLWIRRATHDARTFLDDFVAMTALSGQMICLTCIAIMSLNSIWRVPRHYVDKFNRVRSEPDLTDLVMGLAWRTKLPELSFSFFLAVVIQSITFMAGGAATGTRTVQLPCDNALQPIINGLQRSRNALVMTPSGPDTQPEVRLRPCHSWKATQDIDLAGVVEILAQLGYLAAFVTSISCLLTVCLILVSLFSEKARTMREKGARSPWTSPGSTYVYMSYGLVSITIWNLTSPLGWEPWMWKDPWVNKLGFLCRRG